MSLLCTREELNEIGTGGLLAPVVIYRARLKTFGHWQFSLIQ